MQQGFYFLKILKIGNLTCFWRGSFSGKEISYIFTSTIWVTDSGNLNMYVCRCSQFPVWVEKEGRPLFNSHCPNGEKKNSSWFFSPLQMLKQSVCPSESHISLFVGVLASTFTKRSQMLGSISWMKIILFGIFTDRIRKYFRRRG